MTAHDPRRESGAEYLWERAGAEDAEIARLERELTALRYRPAPFVAGNRSTLLTSDFRLQRTRVPLRAAAALALLLAGIWVAAVFTISFDDVNTMKTQRNALGSLAVVATDGQPRVAGQALQGETSLRAGQWVETDVNSQAEIAVAGFGTVTVEPDSRLRLIHAQKNEQRLELAHGSISAFITAPPRLFVVDTPAATAIDLGCAYRLSVDDSGNGVIEVTKGWVSMEAVAGSESGNGGGGGGSIVSRGALCLTRKGLGAGTPFYADAPIALRRALEQFDFDNGGAAALQIVLNESREADSLTLWHLLSRTSGASRGLVFDRLVLFAPPPSGVTKQSIMRGDAAGLLSWRDTFIWSPTPPTSPIR